MSVIHAVWSVKAWRQCLYRRREIPAISCAFSDGGRYRSGDLIQCGPALTEEAI